MGVASPLLTEAEYAAIEQPIETARTLPRRAFCDASFFKFEVDHLLVNTWVAIGFSDQIAQTGDVRPMAVLGHPILLVRNRSGKLRVFHNVLPYDGCEAVISEAHALREIVTPYHGLTYDLDGRLVSAPFWDGTPSGGAALDARCDLLPIQCAEWFGTIFVNLSGAAEPFDGYLKPVLDFYKDYRLDRLRIGKDESGKSVIHELKCRANWKTMYENYAPNVYHESFVHEMYRKSEYSPRVGPGPTKTYGEILDESGFLGLYYQNHIAASFIGSLDSLPPVLRCDGAPNPTNSIANMYPNWAITVLGNQARMSFFLPETVDLCTQFIATYFDESVIAASEQADDRKASWRAGVKARAEDNRICESIQRARQSPAVASQFFNTFWDRPHYVMTQMFARRYRQACTEQ